MNAPFEKPFVNTESEKKSAEMLVSISSEQKELISVISKEIYSDLSIFNDSQDYIDITDAEELSPIYDQAEKAYRTLVILINDLEEFPNALKPEDVLAKQIAKIKEQYDLFEVQKIKLISELKKRGYIEDDPTVDGDQMSAEVLSEENLNSQPTLDVRPDIEAGPVEPAEPVLKNDATSSVDTDLQVPEPEVAPASPSEPEAHPKSSVEADVNSEGIEELVQMYKSGNPRVFKVSGTEETKNLRKEIIPEINLVLKHEGFDDDRIKHFLNEVVKRLGVSIRDNNLERNELKKATKANRERLAELKKEINRLYGELLNQVSTFLQTVKVVQEEVVDKTDTIEVEEVDLDEGINKAMNDYGDLLKKYKETGKNFSDSSTILNIDSIIVLIRANERERDLTISFLNKEKYLKKLLTEIGKFKEEIEQVGNAKNANLEADSDSGRSTVLASELPVEEDIVESEDEEITPNQAEEAVVSTAQDEAAPSVDRTATIPEERDLDSYRFNRYKSIEFRKDFKLKESAYHDRLKDYYENQSLLSKAYSGTKKLFGLKPKLPSDIEKMQLEYKEARKLYAQSLNDALEARGLVHVGNKEFTADSDTSKRAFGTKFILRPNQELLKVQLEVMKNQEANSRFRRIVSLASKNKKLTQSLGRAVSLTAVAGIGAATGGLAGAGLGAARWATSTVLGASAATYTAVKMQTGVDKAKQKSQEVRNKATENFSLEDLDNLDSAILDADLEKGKAEIRQKAATVGAAFVAGGAVSFGASYLPDLMSSDALASTKVLNDAPVTEPVKPKIVLNGDEGIVEKPATSLFIVKETSISYHGINDGSGEYQTVLSDIKLVGEFKADALTTAQQLEITKFIKLSTDDLLSAHPKMSESVLEAELYERLQTKFGNEAWWKGAKVSGIDIGAIDVRPVLDIESSTETIGDNGNVPAVDSTVETVVDDEYTEIETEIDDAGAVGKVEDSPVTSTAEAVSTNSNVDFIYEVKTGDTLWSIIEQQFAEDLKDLPAGKRMEILDRLFERIEANPELKDSLGINSGDIDLIYANENINLTGIQEEIDKLLEREEIITEFKKSAPIPVQADNTTIDIPIKVIEEEVMLPPQVDTVATVIPEADATNPSATERSLSAVAKEIPKPPRPFSLDGNYFEHQAYKEYIEKSFSSQKAFDRVLGVAIEKFDDATYDVFNKGMYESPYYYFEEEGMTLEQIEEFQERPNSEIRAIFQVNNIKYDTYLAWLDLIDEMKEKLPHKPETKLSDLFARHVAENLVTRSSLVK